MQNYLIRAALTASLYHAGGSSDEVARYESRTRGLLDLDPYPCPVCFLRGEEVTLVLRLAGPWVDQVSCPKCKGHWDVPLPKE